MTECSDGNYDIMSVMRDIFEDLSELILANMELNGLSQSGLARKSGVSKQTISDYINRKRRKPDPEALAAIAHALNLPVELMYHAAGIPTTPSPGPAFQEWVHILSQLPGEEQERLKLFARALLEEQERKKNRKGRS